MPRVPRSHILLALFLVVVVCGGALVYAWWNLDPDEYNKFKQQMKDRGEDWP